MVIEDEGEHVQVWHCGGADDAQTAGMAVQEEEKEEEGRVAMRGIIAWFSRVLFALRRKRTTWTGVHPVPYWSDICGRWVCGGHDDDGIMRLRI